MSTPTLIPQNVVDESAPVGAKNGTSTKSTSKVIYAILIIGTIIVVMAAILYFSNTSTNSCTFGNYYDSLVKECMPCELCDPLQYPSFICYGHTKDPPSCTNRTIYIQVSCAKEGPKLTTYNKLGGYSPNMGDFELYNGYYLRIPIPALAGVTSLTPLIDYGFFFDVQKDMNLPYYSYMYINDKKEYVFQIHDWDMESDFDFTLSIATLSYMETYLDIDFYFEDNEIVYTKKQGIFAPYVTHTQSIVFDTIYNDNILQCEFYLGAIVLPYKSYYNQTGPNNTNYIMNAAVTFTTSVTAKFYKGPNVIDLIPPPDYKYSIKLIFLANGTYWNEFYVYS